MKGFIVDIGGHRLHRRGYFVPPTKHIAKWLFLNPNPSTHPDIVCSLPNLPLESNAADVVLLCEVLEYLYPLHESLYEIHRILKPNGILILSWPFLCPKHSPINGDSARYTNDYLYSILMPHFSILKTYSMGSYFSIIIDLIRPRLARVNKRSLFYLPSRIIFYLCSFFALTLLPLEKKFFGLGCRDTTGYFMLLKKI